MAPTTGVLFLQLSSLVNPHLLSKLVSAAVQKVEKTLYIQIKCLTSESRISSYNKIVNQIYNASSKGAVDRFDTRVILTDLRDSLMGLKPCTTALKTSQTIDTIITLSKNPSYLEYNVENKQGLLNEVHLSVDENFEDDKLLEVETGEIENKFPQMAPEDKMFQHVVIGGTFDQLHSGHKMLISAAILRCEKSLTIGVTDGTMIHTKKLWELIEPCQKRIDKLKEFLMDIEPRIDYHVVPITDPYGPTAHVPNLELLVVSEETLKGGFKVNQLRQEKGLGQLEIHSISLIDDTQASADEESKISSSSLRKRLLGSHIKPPKSKSKPYVIGLTGGIATGKTTICNRLKNLGAHVISCDHLGHAAYKQGTKCYQQMVEYFGDSILDQSKNIDRKKLGPIVFSNKEYLGKLNQMVWPEIRRLYTEEIDMLKNDGFKGVIILDAAILLEAGWDEDCAEVWVSIVPKEEAVKRIVDRDHIALEQAIKRIESQLSNSERVSKANVVLCSIWEPEVTAAQVLKAWKSVQKFLAE